MTNPFYEVYSLAVSQSSLVLGTSTDSLPRNQAAWISRSRNGRDRSRLSLLYKDVMVQISPKIMVQHFSTPIFQQWLSSTLQLQGRLLLCKSTSTESVEGCLKLTQIFPFPSSTVCDRSWRQNLKRRGRSLDRNVKGTQCAWGLSSLLIHQY